VGVKMILFQSLKISVIGLINAIFMLWMIQSCALVRKPTLPNSYRDKIIDDMYCILNSKQLKKLKSLEIKEDIDKFVDNYWKNLDPTPQTLENELRIEYENRLKYADEKYTNPRGWGRSDRKRIFLLYGTPDFIDYTNWTDASLSTARRFKSMEIWVYNNPGKFSNIPTIFDNVYPCQTKFIFADCIGSGVYYLIYNTEEMDYIDPYVFSRSF
jgi:GWxTD domain-containing protein